MLAPSVPGSEAEGIASFVLHMSDQADVDLPQGRDLKL